MDKHRKSGSRTDKGKESRVADAARSYTPEPAEAGSPSTDETERQLAIARKLIERDKAILAALAR